MIKMTCWSWTYCVLKQSPNIQQGRIVKHHVRSNNGILWRYKHACHSQKWKSSKICGSTKTARPRTVCLGSLFCSKGGKKYTSLLPCIWMKNHFGINEKLIKWLRRWEQTGFRHRVGFSFVCLFCNHHVTNSLWPCCVACGTLTFPQLGIELGPMTVKAQVFSFKFGSNDGIDFSFA